MRRWAARFLLFVILAAGLTACGNPCDELAEITCEKVGASAPSCKMAQKRAESADRAEREACRRAYEIYEAATKP